MFVIFILSFIFIFKRWHEAMSVTEGEELLNFGGRFQNFGGRVKSDKVLSVQ